ncbi:MULTISPECIES: efflux RND transporter permease subunit [unclassified Pseudodesulfovibrio]|uniref:efflux RND transporter permease subunit n=1 Tax=unclassified Pseudodesulfovibrio TaxID=2661612 RepID=UPI000FEB9096|nr:MULTISPECIES: efflux RND transporter permease subunit [unclassified Pseudodesulfovibrio]MCJ2166086.1 efflux RND transporter permease subunit [Pseudodesulfovibrio sp. S3-i]RWU02438.1 AcrB/AcrD/AcrF family protein [Pseudodesulfovibrio sp. S3]
MDIIGTAIRKPVAVLVGVILVSLFGMVALLSLPYQLSPNVTEPVISVTTTWTGATPYEMERDVVEEQEKVLKGIPGLIQMESSNYDSRSELTLKFEIGTEIDKALLRVSNKLDEVPEYPDDVDRPIISATGASTSPVIWLILEPLPDNHQDISTYLTFFENEVRQYIERVNGVADLFVGGGREDEMHIIVDPVKLASYNLTVTELISVLKSENISLSAGTLGVGRRDYRIRTPAEFKSPEDIKSVVISSSGQFRVSLGDVATVSRGNEKPTVAMQYNGEKGMVVGIKPEPGTNVLAMTDDVHAVVEQLNAGPLAEKGIHFNWVYDQRPYINGAIDLVKNNIIIGSILAIVVLFVFLQSFSSTIIVAVSIPVSIIGAFIMFAAAGRSLNIVSMAGISFAVGMLVDNAIVVLENVDRHRRMGKSAFNAAYDGTSEVWGAVLASTLTTVAVFLPVVFMEQEAGQLFKDIAIAVTCAIALSLFVSVLVIPMLANQFYRIAERKKEKPETADGPRKPAGLSIAKAALKPLTAFGGKLSDGITALLRLAIDNWKNRLVTIFGMTLASVLLVVSLFPKMEYLPQGNRNLIINILIPPPGLSFEERDDIGRNVFDQVKPHFRKEVDGMPGIENLFFVSAPTINLFGAISTQEQNSRALIPLFTRVLNSIPGMFGVSLQASIFEQGLGEGRVINVDFSGDNLEKLVAVAGTMFGMTMQSIQGAQIRPVPSLELLYPEVRFHPYRDRVKAVGLTSLDLGTALDVMLDGRNIGDFKEEGKKKIDLVLKASNEDVSTPEELYSQLVATPKGWAVPLSSLAGIENTYGVNEIRHLERKRTITLQVTPPTDMPLQSAMEIIEQQLIPAVQQTGLMEDVSVRLSGAADKLTVTRDALKWNFILALIITYLLMAALFENFIYPLIILFTVPLAGAGGFLGLWLENLFIAQQPLDILTMLGFVILIGVVVNNAILIVHQSLGNVREHGMEHKEAIIEATRTRLRPIYMSAATSVFGMLPLAVAPGPGSELYRGLGAVVLGGLALSTVFTVFVIPALLMFVIGMEKKGGSKGEA